MHTGTIVTEDWFGHKSHALAMLTCGVFHHIFVEHEVIGGLQKGIEADIDLGFARGAHFVMLCLRLHPQTLEEERYFTAQILERIIWRDRGVILLSTHSMSQVWGGSL